MKIKISIIATGSSGNAYVLNIGDKGILLDAGVPLEAIRRGNKYRLSNIVGVLITHAHKDHALAVPDLLKNCVPVYCHKNIEQSALPQQYKSSINFFTDDKPTRYLTKGICVRALPQHHDTHCTGYDILLDDCILHYVTDTYKINSIKPLADITKSITEFWICECDYTSQLMQDNDNTESAEVALRNLRTRATHLSDDTVTSFFATARADGIIFVHQSKLNFSDIYFKQKFTNSVPYEIAQAGKVYEFDTVTKKIAVLK